jgi:hypothetical protein
MSACMTWPEPWINCQDSGILRPPKPRLLVPIKCGTKSGTKLPTFHVPGWQIMTTLVENRQEIKKRENPGKTRVPTPIVTP